MTIFGIYYFLSFWGLVCAEAYVANALGVTISKRWAAVDRVLFYLFTAPFIWPVRLVALYRMARLSSQQ